MQQYHRRQYSSYYHTHIQDSVETFNFATTQIKMSSFLIHGLPEKLLPFQIPVIMLIIT
jgi:hypothetical protein